MGVPGRSWKKARWGLREKGRGPPGEPLPSDAADPSGLAKRHDVGAATLGLTQHFPPGVTSDKSPSPRAWVPIGQMGWGTLHLLPVF